MNIQDLRSELVKRAEDAPFQESHRNRMAGISAKRTAHRRAQTAAAAGVAALTVLGVLVLAPFARDAAEQRVDPTPAVQPPDRAEKAFAWPTEYAGDQLVASKIGDFGESPVTLRFTPTTTDLQWSSLCTAPFRRNVFPRVSINGHPLGGSSCAVSDRPGGPGAYFGGGGEARNRRGWESVGVRAGEVSVVEIRLADGPSLPADARLGVAIWDRSGPRLRSDGVTIQGLWESDEATYRLVAYETQPLTATIRELSLAVPDDVTDPVVVSGLDGWYSQVGQSVTTTTVSGSARRDGSRGGGVGGGVIEDIAGETVTVREERDRVRDGTLIIAIYAPID